MLEIVKLIVENIVQDKDCFTISETKGKRINVIECFVNKKNIGFVVGKHGKMADALRTIINAIASQRREYYIIQINERSEL